MMSSNIEQEQKMNQWAETFQNGKFKRFIGSESLKEFYVKHNMPTKVKDCVVDQKARLTLMIVKQMQRKPLKLCKGCFKKVCDEEDCGEEDYAERQPRAYIGADETGKIKVGVAPFKDDSVEELVEDEVYVIEGTIRSFKDVLEINVDSITTESGDGVVPSSEVKTAPKSEAKASSSGASREAIDACKEALELFDGEVPESKFNQLTGSLSATDLKLAMNELGIALIDGKYKLESE